MILPGSASLIVSVAQQLIKLGGRIDNIAAERTAAQSALVLSMPSVLLVDPVRQIAMVRQALADTATLVPDPFGADRAALNLQVNPGPPNAQFTPLFKKYFPDTSLLVNPDAAFLAQLQQAYPTLDLNDPAVRVALFALTPGPNGIQVGYNARIALTVVDTLAEFGAENTALFVRDEKLRGIVQSVLQRFAQPDWAGFTQWSPLLQTALSVTLNSALDVADQLPETNPWLDGVLDALAQARQQAPDPNNYLLGLVQGKGMPLLLSQGLLVASAKLGDASASSFKLVAADVLQAAAPFIQQQTNPNLSQFFCDHWGDLLRAGLSSLDKHGATLLAAQPPLLSSVLTALVQKLSTTPNAGLLSSETLYQLADTAIGAVAQNPAQVSDLTNKPWLAAFINAAAQSAQQLTAKNLLTATAADALLRDAIGVVGKYPNLIVSGDGLPVTLVGSVFTAVAQLPKLDARTIGETAARSALTAIANDPALASKQFGPVVSAVATQLAGYVGSGTLTADQAAGLASAAIDAIARNPQIYAGAQTGIASAVISAVDGAFSTKKDWIARLLVETANQTLLAVARNGAAKTASQPAAQFQQLLTTVLSGGLTAAANQLGTTTDLDGIPPILGALVAKALQGDPAVLDPTSAAFQTAFQQLAAVINSAAA